MPIPPYDCCCMGYPHCLFLLLLTTCCCGILHCCCIPPMPIPPYDCCCMGYPMQQQSYGGIGMGGMQQQWRMPQQQVVKSRRKRQWGYPMQQQSYGGIGM